MIDSQTTLILSALLFFALPVVVLLVLKPVAQRAVHLWCAAGVMAGGGIVLFWFRPYLPQLVSFHLGNTLVLSSLLMWTQSLKMTLGKPWSGRTFLFLLISCFVFYSVLFEWASPSLRGLCVRVVLGGLSFLTAYWAWRLFVRTRSVNAAAISCNYLILGFILAGQAVLTGSAITVPNPFSNKWDASLLAITVLTTALIGHYCYVGMVLDLAAKERMESEQAVKGTIQTQFIGAKLRSMDRKKRMILRSGTLAHELHQPLTAALMNAQMAQRQWTAHPANSSMLLSLLTQVDSGIDRTVQILNRVRADSEVAKLEMSPLDLQQVVAQALELVEPEMRQSEVTLEFERSVHSLVCMGDRLALSQVFFNLLRNAVQAMANQPVRRLTVRCHLEVKKAVVVVCDTGPGMSDDLREKWGDPLVSTKDDGLGMGLAISLDIVVLHKGDLSLRNLTQGGVEAMVRLPLLERAS